MRKIYIISIAVFICMFLTTCSIPSLYGRWSLEKNKAGCPQEIIITKVRYNSGITMAERDNATLYTYNSNHQVMDSLTYSLIHLEGDLYEFNPHSHEYSDFVPTHMKVRLTFEGRKLIFQKEQEKAFEEGEFIINQDLEKITCKYKLEADYQHIGNELFGDIY
jgi:hypothetical protein